MAVLGSSLMKCAHCFYTSLSTSITAAIDTPISEASLSLENTPATPSHASSSGEESSQTTPNTSASPTSSAVQPTSSSTQDQESSETPSKLYPSSSAPDTITQTKDSREENRSDFGFIADVILVEKVRMNYQVKIWAVVMMLRWVE